VFASYWAELDVCYTIYKVGFVLNVCASARDKLQLVNCLVMCINLISHGAYLNMCARVTLYVLKLASVQIVTETFAWPTRSFLWLYGIIFIHYILGILFCSRQIYVPRNKHSSSEKSMHSLCNASIKENFIISTQVSKCYSFRKVKTYCKLFCYTASKDFKIEEYF